MCRVYIKVVNCSISIQYLPYSNIQFLPPFYTKALAPKNSAHSQSTPVNKNNAIGHKRTHTYTDTPQCFCTSHSLSLSILLLLPRETGTPNTKQELFTSALGRAGRNYFDFEFDEFEFDFYI